MLPQSHAEEPEQEAVSHRRECVLSFAIAVSRRLWPDIGHAVWRNPAATRHAVQVTA